MELKELYNKLIEKRGVQFELPASQKDIDGVGKKLGLKIPCEIAELLVIGNGEAFKSPGLFSVEQQYFLSISTKRIVGEWKVWKEILDAGTCDEAWFNPKWIPFTTDESGNGHFIDTRDSNVGEIIYLDHMNGPKVVATSMQEFVDTLLKLDLKTDPSSTN